MQKTRTPTFSAALVTLALWLTPALPVSAAEIDLIVPTHATVRTLSSGNVIQDFWGWVIVTEGILTTEAINDAQVDVSISAPSFLTTSGSLSISNQLGTIGEETAVGSRRAGSLTNNTVFDPLLAPSESLVLPEMDWTIQLDWPGSNLTQTELVTTTLTLDGRTATFQTWVTFVGPGPVLELSLIHI